MNKRVLALLLSVFLLSGLSGCASLFTVGEEKFACKGDPEGGRCGDPKTIYKNKDKILSEYETKENKADRVPVEDSQKIEIKLLSAGGDKVNRDNVPIPVRQVEEVRRVYINGFKDQKGNLISSFWVFTVVNEGDWLLPDGRKVISVE